jgi:hypothetical protein
VCQRRLCADDVAPARSVVVATLCCEGPGQAGGHDARRQLVIKL